MVRKTKKACMVCGKPFYGGKDCFYCPKCAKEKKENSVVRIRTCQDCGVEFYGWPRSRRCPDCAYKTARETSLQHKKSGTMRPLGSIDKCAICGKAYAVKSGRQKYCSDVCQRKGVLDWQREHKRGYDKASGQYAKKVGRRKQSQKECVYCGRIFASDTSSNVCSDYCRKEQHKLQQCISDIRRGYNRDLKKYEDKRAKYKEDCQNDR